MEPVDADRNLLFGVLAMQQDFIDPQQFAEACAIWALRKGSPLADILLELGRITPNDRQHLDGCLERKLRRYGGNVHAMLSAVADGEARDAMKRVDDPDVRNSLSSLPPATGHVLVGTLVRPAEPRSRYHLTRLHAEGGLGKVWLAHDTDLNRDVALKELKPEQAGHPDAWRRFLREAQVTGQLEHPHIVPVYELARRPEDDQPFYTMRFVRGRTLRQAIEEDRAARAEGRADPLEWRKLLQAFVGVCQAIGYAHSRGVIHRDLKPENVVLGGFGEVLVLDWGLAKALGQVEETSEAWPAVKLSDEADLNRTQPRALLGTPAYMAPEQAEGRIDLVDQRTDLYGLGAILFTILTGRPPHEGSDTGDLLTRIATGPTPQARALDRTVPPPLDAVCARAMAKTRTERYASAQDLAREIERWLADEPVSAWREPLSRRARRWVRKHRTLAAATASALLVAAAALGILYRNRQLAERAEQAQAQQWSITLLTDEVSAVPSLAANLGPIYPRVASLLAKRWRDPNLDPQARLRIALVLGPVDRGAREYLADRLLEADLRIVRIIAEGLGTMDARAAVPKFWSLLEDASAPAPRRFRAACGLAILDPPRTRADEARWSHQIDWVIGEALSGTDFPSDELDRVFSGLGSLYPRALARHCVEGNPRRPLAFRLLRVHAERARRPAEFFAQAGPAALILDADPEDFEWLLKILEGDRDRAIDALVRAAGDPDALFGDEPARKGHNPSHRQARALIALARLGRTDSLWSSLRHGPVPDLGTWLAHDAGRYGLDATLLIDRLRAEADPSARAALVLALGGYDPPSIDPKARGDVAALLRDWYRHDPDPGLHGAVSWLFRARWDREKEVHAIDGEMRSRDPSPDRGWFVNGQRQTFAVIRRPQRFLMGSPDAANDPDTRERPRQREIPRSFAIATTEVTVAQYREFVEANKAIFVNGVNYLKRISPEEDCPIHAVKWFEAVLYCRWLSEKEKIADDQMCFPSIPEMMGAFASGKLDLKPGHLKGTGYRLPTEAEWEYACRAGTTTPRYFGRAVSLLSDYAWSATNSGAPTPVEVETRGRTHPVGRLRPNDLGLFDLYGNVREWCLDPFKNYPTSPQPVIDAESPDPVTADDVRSTRGGSFVDPPDWTTSAYRNGGIAIQSVASTGFRVVRTVP